MQLSAEQIKGRIRKIATDKNIDAIILLRIFMMERFLERLSLSKYKDKFIIKGGILISSMVGISLRSTMDIDVSVKGINLTKSEINNIINEICKTNIDGIIFEILDIEDIMNDADYSGIRVSLQATIDKVKVPLSIDVSTSDIITPKEINFEYPLLLENRNIDLYVYNIETILSEKLQTILSRGILNTRLRDYYDILVLLLKYENSINYECFKDAFNETCLKRNTSFTKEQMKHIIEVIEKDEQLRKLWNNYQNKYNYANNIKFNDCIDSIKRLISFI